MADSPAKPDLQARLRDVPHRPGVYVMRDRFGSVIYVGKARDLRRRLAFYFTKARARAAERKTRALIASVWDFEWHAVRNEPESLLLEGKLIKELRPKYNISFRDDKRFLLVRVTLQDEFPRLLLTRLKQDDGSRYFGPYPHSSALRSTLEFINRHLGLRVCRPLKPGPQEYQHCSNDIIKNCCAPCVGRVSLEEYRARILEACEILEGRNTGALVEKIDAEMQCACERLDFERAAQLRDVQENLRKTLQNQRRFERGARALVMSPAADPMDAVRELQQELGLERPPVVMECFDIANIGTAHCVASMVRFRAGLPEQAAYRRYRIRAVSGQNDFISMAEVISRRFSRLLREGRAEMGADAEHTQEPPLEAMQRLRGARLPDLVIVDGGKGQLGVAVEQLQKLGLGGLPIVGLAKQHEEVFRPGESQSLRISHDRPALKLLQRIRDEAHRWANGYHQLLLSRRVEQSLLDQCPGISETRKAALLKEFGSVTRLRRVDAAAIAKRVEGIGAKLAADIVAFLKTH